MGGYYDKKYTTFGMATVCRPDKSNPRWRGKPGQRQCLKTKVRNIKTIAKYC